MNKTFIDILNGIKDLGFGSTLAWVIVYWYMIYFIEGPIMKYIETLFGIEHKPHWYDMVLLVAAITLFLYSFRAYGEFISNIKN